MKLGFLGSGTIASAVMRGISKSHLKIEHIFASTVDMEAGKKLMAEIPNLEVTESSQHVADNVDIIFVALPGQVCAKVLPELKFREGQKIVSFVPTLSLAEVEKMTGSKNHTMRAVPLPFIAEHNIITPIYPADKQVHDIFAAAGGALDLKTEKEFVLFMMAASFMGVYYAFLGTFDKWMADKTTEKEDAGRYLAKLFYALSHEASKRKTVDFAKLEEEYSTKGGTNEMIARLTGEYGGYKAVVKALDEVLAHISK